MLALVFIVIVLAVAFDFINGFHDTANSIATVVSTRVLSPRAAIIMAAGLNFLGALWSTHVATTIGGDIADPTVLTQDVFIAALVGAIAWNLFTWYLAIPSSSSHALIGGIFGAALTARGADVIHWVGLGKIARALVFSPLIGLLAGFGVMLGLSWLLRRLTPRTIDRWFSKLQIASAALMSLSHGSNDAQKSMGLITGALLAGGFIDKLQVPLWVKLVAAVAMAFGTAVGGWRIIKTMGHKIMKMRPVDGFAAESSAAAVILGASYLGLPVSTTHVIASTITGVGATRRLTAVKWSVAKQIGWAMILTFPLSALLAAGVYRLLALFL